MDSLLIVLTVLGVIMILAGIARMRTSNQPSHREEVDHSILFSGQEADASTVGENLNTTNSSTTSEPIIEHEPQQLHVEPEDDQGAVKEATATKKYKITTEQHQKPVKRPRSFLDKLKKDVNPERPDTTTARKKRYRAEAPDWVISLNVMAPEGQRFVGPALLETIQQNSMTFGDMDIFHYTKEDAPVFSLVNMVKPGSFDIENMDTLTTPGISLFVQLPNNQIEGLAAFDLMLATAQKVATSIGGELRDEKRSVLTTSAIDHIRQKIAQYDCKWLVRRELSKL